MKFKVDEPAKKAVNVSIWLPPAELEKLKAMAKSADATCSGVVRQLIRDWEGGK